MKKPGETSYTFKDKSPVQGANYYRLKMIDAKFAYSPAKIVHRDGANMIVKVYPLPAKANINIQILNSKSEATTFYLTELSGKVVFTKTV